jgi:hypothetical protein
VSATVNSSDIVEIIGSLVSAVKTYAAKLPAVCPTSLTTSAIKPTPEVVAAYEHAVLRFRRHTISAPYRGVNDLFVESLEAFEGGRLLGVIQPLLMVLDHLDVMLREKTLALPEPAINRLQEYRQTLMRIMPGNQPELEGAGKGL